MNTQSAGNNQTELDIYNKNESIHEVAEYFNIPYGTAWNRLRKQGRVSKKKKPVYSNTLNKDFFTIIDNEAKAYFAGLIKADGYIDQSRNRLALRLQETDDLLLKRFCDAVNLPIKRINYLKRTKDSHYYSEGRKDCAEVAITNRRFTSNIMDVKSESFLGKIPDYLALPFIRGYFDGDGCINYKNINKQQYQMNIMGNPSDDHMLQYILKYFPNLNLYTDKRSDLPLLASQNKDTIIDFASVYKNALVYLPRKKEKFDLILFKNLVSTSTTTRETT